MLFLNRRQVAGLQLSQNVAAETLPSWSTDIYTPSMAQPLEPNTATGKRICSSVECISTRVSPWRNRKRPIFEEQWACSGRCMLSMIRAAVRRETADGLETVSAQHRHRLPLGLLMLAQGWITHAQLQYALNIQKMQGGRIGDWLVSECDIEREQVTRGLSLQWSCPVLAARGFMPGAMAMVAPKIFVEEFGFVPLRVAGAKLLYLGFEDRLDASSALALEQMTELKVESGLVPTLEYREARQMLLDAEGIPLTVEEAEEADALAARITAILEQKQPVSSRLVRMHKYLWLRLWLEGATKKKKGLPTREGEDMVDYVFTVRR